MVDLNKVYQEWLKKVSDPSLKQELKSIQEEPRKIADRFFKVIDFGTATTFDIINDKCELLGVVIAPGIKTSLEGLATKTAQLPMVELNAPKTVIGKSTVHCMQSGLIFGFAGLVENIIKKIKNELKLEKIQVVATGGLGEIIAKESSAISVVDRTLTLNGLRMIYELNS
jgi:type III pantothenate kinase